LRCSSILGIALPNGIKTIGRLAFIGCGVMTSIVTQRTLKLRPPGECGGIDGPGRQAKRRGSVL